MSGNNEAKVAAVIATYRRPAELRRLLHGLASGTLRPALVVVVDNAAENTTLPLVQEYGLPAEVISLPSNPGCGAAWKRGMEYAMEWDNGKISHLWILDDDIVVPEKALEILVNGMANAGALVAAPLLEDHDGNLWAFPEPVDPDLRKVIRTVTTPAECLAATGPGPHAFCWCTGACVLVHREAVLRAGFYRTDFHILGEDLEYSMRLTGCCHSVFFPEVVTPHLPPLPLDKAAAERSHQIKFLSLLQNLTYLSLHSPDSRHMWKYLPGNYRRYFKTFGWRHPEDPILAGLGGVLGQPAGGSIGQMLRTRVNARMG